jgi:hypothetical protein
MSFFQDPFSGPIFFFSHVAHHFQIKMKAVQAQDIDFELEQCSLVSETMLPQKAQFPQPQM